MSPYLSLKTLSRALVEGCGGLIATETVVRIGKTRLAECYDPHSASFLPVDVVARLEEVAKAPLITTDLAARAGCVLIPVAPVGEGRLPANMAQFGQAAAELFGAYAAATADGKVDRSELERLRRDLGDVLRVTHGALSEVERQMRAGDAE